MLPNRNELVYNFATENEIKTLQRNNLKWQRTRCFVSNVRKQQRVQDVLFKVYVVRRQTQVVGKIYY